MDQSMFDEQHAYQYLQANNALRRAIGVEGDALLEPHYLGLGEHNLNYRFDDPDDGRRFVLRVNVVTQPFHADQVAYEYAALVALMPSEVTPHPYYLDNSESAPCKGALVIGYCEGDELDFDRLRPGDLRCAAQLMADVHAVPVDERCPIHRPADPLRELYDECLQRFEVYRRSAFEDARITRWAESFIAAAEVATHTRCTAEDCAHIVNTETLPSHFLIPASAAARAAKAKDAEAGSARAADASADVGPRFTAPGSFIDWERPVIGEVAQDVAYFTAPTTTFWDSEYLFPADEVDAFVEEYWQAVDGRFERGTFQARFGAWRMMTALRSVTWCCRALTHTTTEKAARKLPVYLSDEFMELLARECFNLRT